MQEQVSFKRFFTELTERIHRDIASQYVEGCIHWVDSIYDNAWFKATERLERGLILFRSGKISEEAMRVEEEIFFEDLQEHVRKYLTYKRLDPKALFLKSFKQGDKDEKAMAV